MGMYKYIKKLWSNPKKHPFFKERLIKWRKLPSTVRIERPTRLDRARKLGYKPKEGIILVRQKVKRGGRQRPKFSGGRRPKAMRRRKIVAKSYQQIAEERANKKYTNCEVLNSYHVAHDGNYSWYEIILVDTSHPATIHNKNLAWITKHKGRAYRGLTSAGRKSRGLRKKGKGAEKVRPSNRAKGRKVH